MAFMDKIKGLTKGREHQITSAVDKAGAAVNKKTKGKYAKHVTKVNQTVDKHLGQGGTPPTR